MTTTPLQLWGGVEGSVVRVGDAWRDQMRETGRQDRIGDLDRIALLGIRTLRCAAGPAWCGWERLGSDQNTMVVRRPRTAASPTARVGAVGLGTLPPGLNTYWKSGCTVSHGATAA